MKRFHFLPGELKKNIFIELMKVPQDRKTWGKGRRFPTI